MSLREPLALLVIVVAALLPGSLLVTRCGKRWREDPVEFLFMSLSLGLFLLGWLALTLAELGYFSLGLLATLWGIVTLGAVWVWRATANPIAAIPRAGFEASAGLSRQPPNRLKPRIQADDLAYPTAPRPARITERNPAEITGRRRGTAVRWELLALCAWLIAASWLFFRPHEFIVGAADAGVYVSIGANIATSGGIRISDLLLAGLDPALYPALLRALPAGENAPYYLLPGFYVTGAAHPGEIIPQFYPLHPTWFAVAYALGGVHAELLMTPLWGLLGCLAVAMTARQLWGWKIGLIALAGISANALQIWFARYPTAEMLTQYLLWTGIWASTAWLSGRRPARLWALMGGLAFGEIFLTRLDTYLLLSVPVLLGFWLWRARAHRAAGIWFLIPCLLLAGQSLLHGLVLSRPYFLNQMNVSTLVLSRGPVLVLGIVAALIAFVALIFLSARVSQLKIQTSQSGIEASAGFSGQPAQPAEASIPEDYLNIYRRDRARKGADILLSILPWMVAGGLAALAVYGYLLRPLMETAKLYPDWYAGSRVPNLDRENLLRLGWYLSPIGILLGVAGACWMLIKDADRRTALLLGIGLCFSLLFLWRIGANPHQIYAMRRYVPQVLPFFILSAAYLVGWLYAHLRGKARWLSGGLTAVWLIGIVVAARGFVSQVDYRDTIQQIDAIHRTLQPEAVLVFTDPAAVGVGDFLGTPLRFLYGHPVYTVRDAAALDLTRFETTLRGWLAEGRAVYWVSGADGLAWPLTGLKLGAPTQQRVVTAVLENSYERKPVNLTQVEWVISVAAVEDNGGQP